MKRKILAAVLLLVSLPAFAQVSFTDRYGMRNVAAYGATCGTTSDDSAAFQSALDAAGTAGGGEVYASACSGSNYYYFLTALVVPSNVTLRCQKGAILRPRADGLVNYPVTNGSGLVGFYGVSNAGINGCTIDSTAVSPANNQPNPIVIGPAAPWTDATRSENIVVQNMTIKTTSHTNGPYMTWVRLANNVKILNNTYEGGQTTFVADGSTDNNGVEVLASNNVTVAGNVLRNIGRYGIYMGSFTAAGTFPNNESRDITFINNQINVAKAGIVLESGADGDGNENYLENIAIYGNSVRDAWKQGIRVGIGGTVSPLTEIYRGVTIANNVVRLTNYSQHPMAMWIEFSSVNGTASGFMVTGNNFYGGQGDTLGDPTGLYLNYGKNIQFTGNVWDGGSTTVVTTPAPIVYIPGNPTANISFTGNYFGSASQSVFYVGAGDDYALTGNIFNGWNAVAGSQPALRIDAPTNRWVVTGNKFIRGAGAEGYLANGAMSSLLNWTWANNSSSYTPSFNRQNNGIWDGTCSTTPGNSPQFGCVTIATGAATASVTNGKVRSGSRIYLNQTTGDPVAAKAAAGSGTFTVTLASNCATANCTFYYEVMQ